jgi:hypothetical protein
MKVRIVNWKGESLIWVEVQPDSNYLNGVRSIYLHRRQAYALARKLDAACLKLASPKRGK